MSLQKLTFHTLKRMLLSFLPNSTTDPNDTLVVKTKLHSVKRAVCKGNYRALHFEDGKSVVFSKIGHEWEVMFYHDKSVELFEYDRPISFEINGDDVVIYL